MSFPPNRSRPSRKPAEADLRGTMSRSDSMDPSVPQFVPSQPKNDNKGSGSTSGLPFTSPPSIRGHRAEVFDHRSNDQRLIEWMQTRFNHIIMTIKETSSIPKNVQDNVAAELRNFIVDFSAKQTLATEAEERLINKIRELERKLIAASRDYADEPGAPTIKELETVIARQREELQIKENQLNGKRILWLASHPPASQQRVDSSSFNLPHSSSRSQTQLRLEAPPSINNSLVNYRTTGNSSMARLSRASLAAMESAAVGDNVSPTQEEYNRVKSSVTVAVPDSALESMPSILDLHNYRNSETETVINQRRSQMPIVPYKNPTVSINEMCISFTKEFGEMFGSMEGWCREYCCVPDLAGDRIIASTNQNLWNYMMSLTYKDPQSAHSHVMALLGNKDTRHWFVMRMALEYCFTQIMSIKSFEQYNHGVHAHLDSIKKRLVAKPRKYSYSSLLSYKSLIRYCQFLLQRIARSLSPNNPILSSR